MEAAAFAYLFACYSIGAAGLAFAGLMSLARPSPLERAYFAFMLGFTCSVVSSTVAWALPGEVHGFFREADRLLSRFGLACIGVSLPAFVARLLPGRYVSAAARVLVAAVAALWLATLVFHFSERSSLVVDLFIFAAAASILHSTVYGIAASIRPRDPATDPDSLRWYGLMNRVKWIALAAFPFFVVFDFFPGYFGLLGPKASGGIWAAPAFYALWNALYIRGALPTLARPHANAAAPVDPEGAGLSPREREVAVLLAEGRSYKEIAAELGISLGTVKTHIARVYEKTGAGTKIELRKRLKG